MFQEERYIHDWRRREYAPYRMILMRLLITNIYTYNPMLSWYYLTMLYLHNRVHGV